MFCEAIVDIADQEGRIGLAEVFKVNGLGAPFFHFLDWLVEGVKGRHLMIDSDENYAGEDIAVTAGIS